MIDLPSEFNFRFYLIPFGYGNIVHVVPDTAYPDMGRFHDADCRSHPASYFILYPGICPMSHNNFTLYSHTAHHMAEFPVAVGRLVLVHEIHINGIIRDFLIELGMQMAQRLAVFLQSQNPHFCGGEGMHPGDNPCTSAVFICLVKGSSDGSRID